MDISTEQKGIIETVQGYFGGVRELDAGRIKAAFWSEAHEYGVGKEGLCDHPASHWDETCRKACEDTGHIFHGGPTGAEIRFADGIGTAGTARADWRFGDLSITDYYTLMRLDDRWRIINEVHHLQRPGDDGPDDGKEEEAAVHRTLKYFFDGLDNLDAPLIKKAFHPQALMGVIGPKGLAVSGMDMWDNTVQFAREKPDHPFNREKSKKKVALLDITGNTAAAKVEWVFSEFMFTDFYTMLKLDDRWQIMNKVYHTTRF